jgi:ABC-2 type transport system ATP-binding protein
LNDLIIATKGLRKSYGGAKPAVCGLDLAVPRGSICGFLGRNGAGKTTTLKLLLGLLRADSGEILLFGETVNSEASSVAARQRLGFVSEDKELYPFMNVGQTIRFTRAFFPNWRRDLEEKYLDLFRLPKERSIPKLSRGMRTQLMLLLAMARGAELLVMDEPTSGLDPAVTEDVLQALADLAACEGTTVFFSSHELPEVEQICDRVCLIDNGQTVIEGVLDDLKSQYQRILLAFDGEAPCELADIPHIDHLRRRGRTASLLAHLDVNGVVDRARELGPNSVEVRPVTLKELFLDHVRGE